MTEERSWRRRGHVNQYPWGDHYVRWWHPWILMNWLVVAEDCKVIVDDHLHFVSPEGESGWQDQPDADKKMEG